LCQSEIEISKSHTPFGNNLLPIANPPFVSLTILLPYISKFLTLESSFVYGIFGIFRKNAFYTSLKHPIKSLCLFGRRIRELNRPTNTSFLLEHPITSFVDEFFYTISQTALIS